MADPQFSTSLLMKLLQAKQTPYMVSAPPAGEVSTPGKSQPAAQPPQGVQPQQAGLLQGLKGLSSMMQNPLPASNPMTGLAGTMTPAPVTPGMEWAHPQQTEQSAAPVSTPGASQPQQTVQPQQQQRGGLLGLLGMKLPGMGQSLGQYAGQGINQGMQALMSLFA